MLVTWSCCGTLWTHGSYFKLQSWKIPHIPDTMLPVRGSYHTGCMSIASLQHHLNKELVSSLCETYKLPRGWKPSWRTAALSESDYFNLIRLLRKYEALHSSWGGTCYQYCIFLCGDWDWISNQEFGMDSPLHWLTTLKFLAKALIVDAFHYLNVSQKSILSAGSLPLSAPGHYRIFNRLPCLTRTRKRVQTFRFYICTASSRARRCIL